MSGRLFLLIRSWRVRAALLWLAHRPSAMIGPLAGIGLADFLGLDTPAWVVTAGGWLTTLLVPATLLGMRLHRELDEPGVPCRWCPIEADDLEAHQS
ncbi:hypothetical protein [Streptomyces sp. NPDC093223]|uniref:hypothetical protein n=1 Tax=Streptomyces sp. NPDC093223 TaxID=3366033 RepID=UPI003817488D